MTLRRRGDGLLASFPMIGLSVAVGRFVEALFWAILRVAGMVGGVALLVMMVLGVAWWLIRRRR